MFGIKLITDRVTSRRNKANGELLVAHEAAVLASTGVFLDTSVYFALSICFAAIIFNYRDKPLLYEDSMYFRSFSFLLGCIVRDLRHVREFTNKIHFETRLVLYEWPR